MERTGISIHNGKSAKQRGFLRVVCMSDNHGSFIDVPAGDIFIHAGDFCRRGNLSEIIEFNNFIRSLNFRYKVVVAGNHDSPFDPRNFELLCNKRSRYNREDANQCKRALRDCIYLEDSGINIEGYNIWGSPWTKQHNLGAFTTKDKGILREKWNMIPGNTDILVTHSPPYGKRDYIHGKGSAGCTFLEEKTKEVRPLVHVFGHIHEGRGVIIDEGITYTNVAICNRKNNPVFGVTAFDLPIRE